MRCLIEFPRALRSPLYVAAAFGYAVLLTAIAPSRAAAETTTYHLPDFWPILDKVQLTYQREVNGGGAQTITHTISGPYQVGAYYPYRLEYRNAKKREWARDYLIWSNGALKYDLYEDSHGNSQTYTNPVEIMPFDLPADAKSLLVGDGGQYYTDSDIPGTDTVRVTCDGFEDLILPAGTYTALHVETRRDWKDTIGGFYGNDITHYWLVEGLGPVRRYATFSVYDPGAKQWVISTQDDQLVIPPVIVDLSSLAPVVRDQSDLAGGIGLYNDASFAQGYGAGACWAMGYYYKSFQETAQAQGLLGARATDAATDAATTAPPPVVVSPYFLWNNGGASHFHFSGALMAARGVPPLDAYPSYATPTSDTHLAAAAPYKTLGYYPFFAHVPAVSSTGRFTSLWANDITPLKTHLSPPAPSEIEAAPLGDCFVLGIPVFQSFADYTGGVYTVADATDEKFLGFQAVCVVGCNDITHAFRIVNSWGAVWGENGYGWLSYDFVRKYAIEAWWMADSTGFGPDPKEQPAKNGATYIFRTKDYQIGYTPYAKGRVSGGLTEAGIRIANGDKRDTLSIKKRPGIRAGETIPTVVTDAGFASVYSEAPIALLQAAGQIKSLATKGANVACLIGQDFRTIGISTSPNSTWQFLSQKVSQHPNGYHEITGKWLNAFAHTEITDSLTTPPFVRANITLTGTSLSNLASNKGVTLKISTKKNAPAGAPVYYSYAGVDKGALLDVVGDLWVSVAGGAFAADAVQCYGVRNLAATGLNWSSVLKSQHKNEWVKCGDYYNGDVAINSLFSRAAIANISATGGNLSFHAIASNMNIAKLAAKHVKATVLGETEFCGGYVGDAAAATSSVITAGYGEPRNVAWATIGTTYGSLGVAAKFVAGSGETGAPNYLGLVNTIKANAPSPGLPVTPVIVGEAHIRPDSTMAFPGVVPTQEQFHIHYSAP